MANQQKEGGLSLTAIIPISIISIVALLATLILAACWLLRMRRRQQQADVGVVSTQIPLGVSASPMQVFYGAPLAGTTQDSRPIGLTAPLPGYGELTTTSLVTPNFPTMQVRLVASIL